MPPVQYSRGGKQRFGRDRGRATTGSRLPRLLVCLLLACCLLILVGLGTSPTLRGRVCSRGKLGILYSVSNTTSSISTYQTAYTSSRAINPGLREFRISAGSSMAAVRNGFSMVLSMMPLLAKCRGPS